MQEEINRLEVFLGIWLEENLKGMQKMKKKGLLRTLFLVHN